MRYDAVSDHAVTTSASGAERRRYPRFDADFRVYFLREGEVVGSAEVIDLSASGIHLRHEQPAQIAEVGGLVEMCVHLPSDAPREEITLLGTAVRVGQRELALSFAQADIGDAALLASLWCDRQIPPSHSERGK